MAKFPTIFSHKLHVTYIWTCLILAGLGCTNSPEYGVNRTINLPASRSPVGTVQAVVETSLGSYTSIKYDPDNQVIDPANQQQETMLPYVCNAGFIPVGDKDRISVWIMGQRLQAGHVLSIIPLALVEYTEGDQMHTDVLAVPSDTLLQSIQPSNFRDLIVTYEPVKFSFEYWLRNRFGVGSVSRIAWKDDEAAVSFVVAQINGNPNAQ